MHESWRKVWRDGFVPLLSTRALKALRDGLAANDARLTQGATTRPCADPGSTGLPPWAACAAGYCGWQGEGLRTVGEVDEYFARLCYEADKAIGEPAGCRWFLDWFDWVPREEAFAALLPEVVRALAMRPDAAEEKVAS